MGIALHKKKTSHSTLMTEGSIWKHILFFSIPLILGNMLQQFQQFKKQMQGVNPQEEVQKLLQSGKISQAQLDKAQRMAQQMQGLFK